MVRLRVRIRFCKQGDLRLVGHRDLMRCFERLFRRAKLKLGMSQGFHPKVRMTFPLALALGIEGSDEVMELELAESCTAGQVHKRLAPQLPPGLAINSVQLLPQGGKKARVRSVSYEVPIPSPRRRGLDEKIDRLLAGSSCFADRPGRPAPVNFRPLLEKLTLREGVLQMRLLCGSPGARPSDVFDALGLGDLQREGADLRRTTVEIQS